jgi:hypothetical protein
MIGTKLAKAISKTKGTIEGFVMLNDAVVCLPIRKLELYYWAKGKGEFETGMKLKLSDGTWYFTSEQEDWIGDEGD